MKNNIYLIVFDSRISEYIFFDCLLFLIDYRIFVTILDKINTIALRYMGS